MDFTDASHPIEIAYFDRGPIDSAKRALGGQWSTYWYNGYIYGSEIARGLDVFKLVPNKYITQREIDAAIQVHFDELNVQNQPKIVWPANFIVARAYIDQLTRSNALEPKRIAALVDDPYRSLAGLVRNAGGFAKDQAPFAEFLWADFFRPQVAARLIDKDPKRATREALRLARSDEARYLPGWSGKTAG